MIRPAVFHDKKAIFELCDKIYPAGDYIRDVWDAWFQDNTISILDNDEIIGMYNAINYKSQGWIEGIRVDPSQETKYGSMLINDAEAMLTQQGSKVIRMFIDTKNLPSLKLARKNGYKIASTYYWYGISNYEKTPYKRINPYVLDGYYVDSWRAYELNTDIIFLDSAAFTMKTSRHFPNTTLLTILEMHNPDGFATCINEIVSWKGEQICGFDATRPKSGIHIVSDKKIKKFDKISSYYLVEKQ